MDDAQDERQAAMGEDDFRAIVQEAWAAVPAPWKDRVRNVALLVEDEPSEEVRAQEGLEGDDTLLGIYQGIPSTERGEGYGIGMTLPDTITVYRLPTLDEASLLMHEDDAARPFSDYVRLVVRETVWHELGHYFGHGEAALMEREDEKRNTFE